MASVPTMGEDPTNPAQGTNVVPAPRHRREIDYFLFSADEALTFGGVGGGGVYYVWLGETLVNRNGHRNHPARELKRPGVD